MADDLNGRRALVTGASGGIGGALAIRLAEHGADIALSYASHREDAEAVAQRVSELGRNSVVLQADLRDPDTPGAIVRQARQALGGLDALVPNAGTGTQLPWQKMEADTWDATMAMNLRAVADVPGGAAGHGRTRIRPDPAGLVHRRAHRRHPPPAD